MKKATGQIQCDVAIIGGGIAGLWLQNLLTEHGYSALLIEKSSLGEGQTLASQGMIHGGIKYTLSGTMTGASETIRDMPARWQACLSGSGTLDLSGVSLLSRDYYLFSDASISSRVTAFFGSKAVEGRVDPVSREDYPAVFRNAAFRGSLYRLQDVVIDTASLLDVLSARQVGRILQGEAAVEPADGDVGVLHVADQSVRATRYIFAAGEGNDSLLRQLGSGIRMQLRPLHQSIVTGDLPALYAHAVSLRSGDKPRMTITSHPIGSEMVWYLGGQLAESGVRRSAEEQIAFTKKELASVFPWIDFSSCRYSTLRINRAEPAQAEAARPDEPFVAKQGNAIICWPTKLTLVPMLGDMVLPELPAPGNLAPPDLPASLSAVVGSPPWS